MIQHTISQYTIYILYHTILLYYMYYITLNDIIRSYIDFPI